MSARGLPGRRRYGCWSGQPGGVPERLTDCAVELDGVERRPHQCRRRRGHGPGGLFCRQHAKQAAAGRPVHVPHAPRGAIDRFGIAFYCSVT